MEIVEKKENQLTFSAEIDETLANAIRRYVNKIPVLAIDEVEISKNDSPLYDETIAHRMGLIPLKEKKTNAEPKLTLESNHDGFVYSGELKGDAEIIYDKMPITFLKKGQELVINATTKKGQGIDHSKFSPGLIYYRKAASITINKKFLEKIKEICPENEIKEKGDKIIVADNKKREVSDVCDGICEKEGETAVVEYSKDLIITVESFGQIGTQEIFKNSIDILKKDLNELSKKIK